MKDRFHCWVSIITVLSAALVTQHAIACTCIGSPPPHEAAAKADVVFVGTVLEINEERDEGDDKQLREFKKMFGWPIDYGYRQHAVDFRVSAVIKGDPASRVVVRTNASGAACGYPFEKAIEYLVYAYSNEGKLHTSGCSRTTPSEEATDEIQELMSDGGQPSNTYKAPGCQ